MKAQVILSPPETKSEEASKDNYKRRKMPILFLSIKNFFFLSSKSHPFIADKGTKKYSPTFIGIKVNNPFGKQFGRMYEKPSYCLNFILFKL